MTATGERELRRAVQDTLGSLQPPPAPIEAIIRQGKRSRLRRTGAAAGGLALAGIIAVAALAGQRHPGAAGGPGAPVRRPGRSGRHHRARRGERPAWRLAAQNIADPGYACVPAITLNGTDADPVYPDPVSARGHGSRPRDRVRVCPAAGRRQRDRGERADERAGRHRNRLRVPLPRGRLRLPAGPAAPGDRAAPARGLAGGVQHAGGQHAAAQRGHDPGDRGIVGQHRLGLRAGRRSARWPGAAFPTARSG